MEKDEDKSVVGEISYKQWWELIRVVVELHSIARRYADGRRSYITSMFNSHTRFLLDLGFPLLKPDGTLWARDTMGRIYDGLSEEEAQLGREPDKKFDKPTDDEVQYAQNELLQELKSWIERDDVPHAMWGVCSCINCARLWTAFERWKETSTE